MAVVMLAPFTLLAVSVTLTDSCAWALNAVRALVGRLTVSVTARPAWAEPCAWGSEYVLLRFRPWFALISSVRLPCSVTFTVWLQRTTNESVPGLGRRAFRLCVALVAGGRSTSALLARIVHDGLGAGARTAVGATGVDAEFAGGPVLAGFDGVSVPARTLPASSPITQNVFGEHASPVMMRNGSTAEVVHAEVPKVGVVEVRTFPSSSAATHSELVGHTSCWMVLAASMLEDEGADQFGPENGAAAVSTRPCESIPMQVLLVGHASR